MRSELKEAYTLISDFKRGAFSEGLEITAEQQRLIQLLSKDLQVQSEGLALEQLVQQVAKADSVWNKRTMAVIDRFYTLRDAGNLAEAESERSAFADECPSAWYCGIVNSL
jgi:hypothetical protein